MALFGVKEVEYNVLKGLIVCAGELDCVYFRRRSLYMGDSSLQKVLCAP